MFGTLPFNCRPLPCPISEKLLTLGSATNPSAPTAPASADAAGAATAAGASLPRVTSLLNLAECVDQWKKAFLANKKVLA